MLGWAWGGAAAVGLLAVARWLDSPGVEYLVVASTATVATIAALRSAPRSARWWHAASAALVVAAIVVASFAQHELRRIAADWDRYRTQRNAAAVRALGEELTATTAELSSWAHQALAAPHDRATAFRAVRAGSRGVGERGVVLFERDQPLAWGGRIRLAPDSLRDSIGVTASTFYLVLYSTATRGDRRAVAMVLLDAAPPADRLADPLARHIADRAGVAGFVFTAPSDSAGERLRFTAAGQPLVDAIPVPLRQGEVALARSEQARGRVALLFAVALACFVVGVWRQMRRTAPRLLAIGVAIACVALSPLNELSNFSRLFDPALFYTPLGGRLSGNAGALGLTSALALLAVLAVFRRHGRRPSRWPAAVIVLLVAGVGPFLLRDLARGIRIPTYGATASLWLIWEVPLFLAAVSVLLAGAGAGGVLLGRTRGVPGWIAPVLATLAATLAPIVWDAPGQWPWWYTLVWVAAIGALALARQSRVVVLSAATVAALGATTLVWGRTTRGRVTLAERDLASLGQPDPYAGSLLQRFAAQLQTQPTARSRGALLESYVSSDLAAAGFPTLLVAFPPGGVPLVLRTAPFAIPADAVTSAASLAHQRGTAVFAAVDGDPAVAALAAVPAPDGGAMVVAVAPRTRLIPSDPFARLLGLDLDPEAEPPYSVQLSAARLTSASPTPQWIREDDLLHGDWIVQTGRGPARAHVDVEIRPLSALVQRGALILMLDLAFVAVLWLASVVADGGVGRWLKARRRTIARSYRARLSLALFAFFTVPALAFAIWSYQQLAAYAVQSRDLLVRGTLRAVAAADSTLDWVPRESERLDTPLLLYASGELGDASDPLYVGLAPFGRFIPPDVDVALMERDEISVSRAEPIAGTTALLGFRTVDARGGTSLVVAAPARADDLALGRRRRDLSVLVLFATAFGAVAALWLSGIAARQLARPIGSLRRAALALAGGERIPPLDSEPTIEFVPVFSAFRRMASDLNASRSALEDAQRRTTAVLRNVASGVAALDTSGRVVLANPQAESLLDVPLAPGTDWSAVAPAELSRPVIEFLTAADDERAFDLDLDAGARQVRVRLSRLQRGGVVVTLDDVTQLARAQRVLAWGEMARQVAHEIKNPLTPIRLGVQHLRRARADRRVDFDRVLDENVERILTEIDRLDEIARAFSRYGSAPAERAPAEPTDVAAVVRDVVGLERMGGGSGVRWLVEGAEAPVSALARGDELREVLLNVFENARLAHATQVVAAVERCGDHGAPRVEITVRDDGHGVPEAVLSRVFEPHFSTRTSGSGLGLAISRRLIDGWGGEITLDSTEGKGTTVRITLREAGA